MQYDYRALSKSLLNLASHDKHEPSSMISTDLSWARFGIRDPSILLSLDGTPIVDDHGRLTVYFNSRSAAPSEGGITRIGLAMGNQAEGWSIRDRFIFEDGSYAAQGSVIKEERDSYLLYYSPDTAQGFRYATSKDGVNWQRNPSALCLSCPQFGVSRMGLPYVTCLDDRWYMVFEGIWNGRFRIFMASSMNGRDWQAENDGQPIYQPDETGWDVFAQANPSLYQARNGDGPGYFILYNGCASANNWEIGIMGAARLSGPWSAGQAPVLKRSQLSEWACGRLEGARLLASDNEEHQNAQLLLFGLPTTDSYAQGKIATISLRIKEKMATPPNREAEITFNNKLADSYFDIWDKCPIQLYTTESESAFIQQHVRDKCTVLVAGSGGGREIPVLLEKSCRITAMDISPGMLEAGKQRYPGSPINWLLGDIHSLPQEANSLGAIVALGAVFNYLDSAGQFLTEAARCLEPGGRLIMAVLNNDHASERHGSTTLRDGRIRNLYKLTDIEEMLRAAKLENIAIRGIRFLVDMLPAEWNRKTDADAKGRAALLRLVEEEKHLAEIMPADRAKFILIAAEKPASA